MAITTVLPVFPNATAANLASAAHAINTVEKFQTKIVMDTTNNRLMFATGPSPTDQWWVVDGSASITPS